MAKETIRNRITSLSREISNNWTISIVTGIACAFVAGLYATVSPHIPIDLKQPDVLFIISMHLLVFVSGCILVFFGRGRRLRLLPLLMPLIAGISFFFYYEKIVIYGINSVEGPKVIVFYPDEFEDIRLEAEWSRSLREIPNSIKVEDIQISLLKWPSRFSGKIDNTTIGRIVNKRADVIGHVGIFEGPDGILLQLNLPSLQGYQDLGFSYVKTLNINTGLIKYIELSAGFDLYACFIGFKLDADGPHLGHLSGRFSTGVGYKPDCSLDEIAACRNLQVADVLQVPKGSLTRGASFGCYMLAAAYFRQAGFEENFCDTLDRFTRSDEKNPEYDLLSEIDKRTSAACLWKKGPKFIDRIIAGTTDEQRDEVLRYVLARLLESSDYDRKYSESDLFSEDTLNAIINFRKFYDSSEIDFSDSTQVDSILRFLTDNKYSRESHPLLWRTFADEIDIQVFRRIFGQMFFLDPVQIDGLMVNLYKIRKFFNVDSNPCELPWDIYLMAHWMPFLQLDSDSRVPFLDWFTNRMLFVAKETDCNEILLYDWDATEFLNNEKQRRATFIDLHEVMRIAENNGKIREIIAQSKAVIAPYVSKDSKLRTFFDGTDHYSPDETLKLIKIFIHGLVKETTSERMAGIVLSVFESLLSDFDSEQVFDATIDEFSDMIDRGGDRFKQGLKFFAVQSLSLFDSLRDPMASEALRFIKKAFVQEEAIESFGLEPAVIKNPLHTILLYRMLSNQADSPDKVDRLLKSMVANYPKEQETPLAKHFKMIQAHYAGNVDKAIEFAEEIIAFANIPQQSFYLFYVESMKQSEAEVQCISLTEDLPPWTGRMLDHDRQLLIEHLLQNRFDKNVWHDVVADHPTYTINSDHELNIMSFKQTLAHYLLEYTCRQPGVRPSSDEAIEEPDNALLQAIVANQHACSERHGVTLKLGQN